MFERLKTNFREWIKKCKSLKLKKMNTYEKVMAIICGILIVILITVAVIVSAVNSKKLRDDAISRPENTLKYDLTFSENFENITDDELSADEENGIYSKKTAFFGTLEKYAKDTDSKDVQYLIVSDKDDLFNSGEYETVFESKECMIYKFNEELKKFAEKRADNIYENEWETFDSEGGLIVVLPKN